MIYCRDAVRCIIWSTARNQINSIGFASEVSFPSLCVNLRSNVRSCFFISSAVWFECLAFQACTRGFLFRMKIHSFFLLLLFVSPAELNFRVCSEFSWKIDCCVVNFYWILVRFDRALLDLTRSRGFSYGLKVSTAASFNFVTNFFFWREGLNSLEIDGDLLFRSRLQAVFFCFFCSFDSIGKRWSTFYQGFPLYLEVLSALTRLFPRRITDNSFGFVLSSHTSESATRAIPQVNFVGRQPGPSSQIECRDRPGIDRRSKR